MKKLYLVLFSLILIFTSTTVFADEDLRISNWEVNSALQKNGDLIVVEDITFKFNDKFNGVFRNIVLERIDGIKDLKISLLTNGNEDPYSLVESAKNGDANVFTVKEDKNNLEVKIFSPSKNEEKTFRLQYIVRNLAVHHLDTGELYYKFIGQENETPIDNLSININLPYEDREETKIFAHGPLHGNISFVRDNLINLQVSQVPSKTFVEARVLFPKYFIEDSPNTENNTKENIIKEEIRFAEELENKAIAKEKTTSILGTVSLVLSAVGILITSFFFNKLRRDREVYESLQTASFDDIRPGELRLFHFSLVDGRSLMTIIFDLARKEYIDIEEIESDKKKKKDFQFTIKNKIKAGLLSHEKFVLDWLFNDIGDGKTVNTREIENYRKKNSSKYYKAMNSLLKLTREDLKARDYMDPKRSIYGALTLIASFILFPIGVATLAFGNFYGILALLLGIALFVYSISLFFRKSDKGFIQYELWKDFKKKIQKEKELLGEYDISVPTEEMLIYALALGLPMKSLEKFKEPVTLYSSTNHWAYWYFMTNSRGGSSFEDRFNSSFYGNSATSTSSSIGGGGGFSGGGGGGAGGGGAGGF